MAESEIELHGFTAVPVELTAHLDTSKLKISPPSEISITNLGVPDSGISKKALARAKKELHPEAFNHSLRVYSYGIALRPYLAPSFSHLSRETWLLACLFHDIGTAPQYLSSTHISFDFYGGILAYNILREEGAPQIAIDGASEAIIRHQDLGSSGYITTMGALLQISTIVDNTGQFAEFVSPTTVKNIIKAYPRLGWSACFSSIVRKEGELKPWCHSSKMGVGKFASDIEANKKTDGTGLDK